MFLNIILENLLNNILNFWNNEFIFTAFKYGSISNWFYSVKEKSLPFWFAITITLIWLFRNISDRKLSVRQDNTFKRYLSVLSENMTGLVLSGLWIWYPLSALVKVNLHLRHRSCLKAKTSQLRHGLRLWNAHFS